MIAGVVLACGIALAAASSRSAKRWKAGPFSLEIRPAARGWEWRAWYTYDEEEADLATGTSPSAALAAADARAWAFRQAPGLEGQTRHGLRWEAENVEVASLREWIAWASPLLDLEDVDPSEAPMVVSYLFGEAFGDSWQPETIRGKTVETITTGVQKAILRLRAGELFDVSEPEEVIAARVVGMSAPKRPGRVEYFARWVLVVDEHPSARGYRWRVWPNLRIGPAVESGAGPTIDSAAAAARSWIREERSP